MVKIIAGVITMYTFFFRLQVSPLRVYSTEIPELSRVSTVLSCEGKQCISFFFKLHRLEMKKLYLF